MENPFNKEGWTQVSPKVWLGNRSDSSLIPQHYIKIKKPTKIAKDQRLKIQCFSEAGFEEDRADTIEQAIESVAWFMRRRPQVKEVVYNA